MRIEIPQNHDVVAFLSRRREAPALVAASDSSVDPYVQLGSHPDAVERVWDQLGGPFGKDACQIVHGTPSLVHPTTGIIIAVSLGTAYALRLPQELRAEAEEAGLATRIRWSDGRTTDLEVEIGAGWYFGRWHERELEWMRIAYG
jgi:hypothetical protein